MSDVSNNGATSPPAKPGTGMIVLLVVSWIWVGIPLCWGVGKTVEKSLPLFQMSSAAQTK